MKNIGTVVGRHDIPVVIDAYIYPQEVNPLDIVGLTLDATDFFKRNNLCGRKLNLYITGGLTVTTLAAINAAYVCKVKLTVMHYDRASGSYYQQEMYF